MEDIEDTSSYASISKILEDMDDDKIKEAGGFFLSAASVSRGFFTAFSNIKNLSALKDIEEDTKILNETNKTGDINWSEWTGEVSEDLKEDKDVIKLIEPVKEKIYAKSTAAKILQALNKAKTDQSNKVIENMVCQSVVVLSSDFYTLLFFLFFI